MSIDSFTSFMNFYRNSNSNLPFFLKVLIFGGYIQEHSCIHMLGASIWRAYIRNLTILVGDYGIVNHSFFLSIANNGWVTHIKFVKIYTVLLYHTSESPILDSFFFRIDSKVFRRDLKVKVKSNYCSIALCL